MGTRQRIYWLLVHAPIVVLWVISVGWCVRATASDSGHRSVSVAASAAVSIYWMAYAWILMAGPRAWSTAITRTVWTLAFVALVIHILIAFDVAHGWSHAVAVDHVRRIGGFGGGIVVNYLFAAVWLADVLWWWISPTRHARRPREIGWAIHGFLLFVVVNATLVFGSTSRQNPFVVLFALALLMGLCLRVGRRWLTKGREETDEPGQRPGSVVASEPTANHSPT